MKTVAKWTIKAYHRLLDSGLLDRRRVELIGGEILEMTPEIPFHAFVTDSAAEYLQTLLQGWALVREAHPIALADSEPEPDMAIVRSPRQQYSDRHPSPTDIFWIIEVSRSTLEYELTVKKSLYARASIAEYWVIDIDVKRVHVFRQPAGEQYNEYFSSDGEEIILFAFPDIRISVERLWT
jgi:Uma2 family endonuclease